MAITDLHPWQYGQCSTSCPSGPRLAGRAARRPVRSSNSRRCLHRPAVGQPDLAKSPDSVDRGDLTRHDWPPRAPRGRSRAAPQAGSSRASSPCTPPAGRCARGARRPPHGPPRLGASRPCSGPRRCAHAAVVGHQPIRRRDHLRGQDRPERLRANTIAGLANSSAWTTWWGAASSVSAPGPAPRTRRDGLCRPSAETGISVSAP
jgi:hypothetical protein